jgi:Fe-S oxidoreductase
VDLARLKAEFLHQYYQKHGLPWRYWLFGNVATVSKWGCRLAPVSNWLMRGRPVRWLNEKLLGIDRRRVPPRFTRRPGPPYMCLTSPLFTSWETDDSVLLFCDTFTHFFEPAVRRAAMELFRRLRQPGAPEDYRVRSWMGTCDEQLKCCGRPLISNGLLAQAAELARHNVSVLFPLVEGGKPMFACEPSCILTMKDDYPALLSGELHRKAEAVAAACTTFEDLFEARLAQGPDLRFRPGPKKILVQGHCHQRSLVGLDGTLRLLRRIPGAEVIDLDAGCCGMAGSFGYEKEHYEVSRLVGEQRLFPAIREAGPDAVIVAPGFSCRLQIQHFTGRVALHPAQLLWDLLKDHEPAGP